MFSVKLDSSLNCLSLNKDCSLVVVAGRSVFKVFKINDDKFTEDYNLRVGKVNLDYSAMAVAWNPLDDNIIASAATNGAVVIWNLSMPHANKKDVVYNEHKRAVNKVAFNRNEAHTLLSGSADGYMKLFDLRRKEAALEFFGRSESVRDIQFNPHSSLLFAAAFDNGTVQTWDMRFNKRPEKSFQAHSDPVLSIDFHPDEKNWIGTSGRDKVIKVWDLSAGHDCKHVVQNISGVAQIKWRPQRKYHISSCSLLLDFSVNVWDIRRPYIPFASFRQHKDCVTGIEWKANNPHAFYTSSKDDYLWAHDFEKAERPADKANPVSVNIDNWGRVLHSSSSKPVPTGDGRTGFGLPNLPRFRKTPDRTEQFTRVSSSLTEFTPSVADLDMGWFLESAKRYRLTGASVEELCAHNAAVAASLNRAQVSQTWQLLRLLFSCHVTTPPAAVQLNKPVLSSRAVEASETEGKERRAVEERNFYSESGDSTSESSTSKSESDAEATLTGLSRGRHGTTSHSDLFFVDTDQEPTGFDLEDEMTNLPESQECSLPEEALQVRVDMGQLAAESPQHSRPPPANPPVVDAHTGGHSGPDIQAQVRQKILSTTQFTDCIPTWSFKQQISDLLQFYADQGDVQMAACILIVLGDKVGPYADDIKQEQWLIGYRELLARFRLYSLANSVLKLSGQPRVGMLNQQSTTVHTGCSRCRKALLRAGWLCDRCPNRLHICALCNQPVKGLFVWCQGCCHGGHIGHMKDWFSRRKYCPTGCGHLCEYASSSTQHR